MNQISTVWQETGLPKWPLLLSFIVIACLSLWSANRLLGQEASPDLRTKAWIDAILFWGGFAMISGLLGTFVGLTLIARAIEVAGDVSTPIIWGGIKVAMLSSLFGLLLLAFSSLIWFALQLRWRLLQVREEFTHMAA